MREAGDLSRSVHVGSAGVVGGTFFFDGGEDHSGVFEGGGWGSLILFLRAIFLRSSLRS